jgi:excisionase family DNA binding protein
VIQEKLLKPEQVAERLSVSPLSVKKWLRAGRLKGVKVSGMWRVKESELQELIQEVEPDEEQSF